MPIKASQSENQRIPKLRFLRFSGGWEKKKLGDICKMQAGKFMSSSDIKENYEDNLFPCYGGNGLRGFTKSFTHSGIYSLIGRQGALCGNVTLVEGDFHATEHAVVVTPETNTNTIWLYYILGFLNLNQHATGQAQPGLSVSNLKQVELFIPTNSKEQQKIADFLGCTDELISNLKEQKENLESYKKGVMQKIFSQEIRFKDQKGKEFPKWEEKKLGQIFSAEKGDGLPKNEVVEDGFNECVLYGELYTTYKEVVFNVISKTNSKDGLLSQVGDLLIPCSTTTTGIDLANVTALNKKGVLLGGDITVLRSKEKIDNIFYAYYLSNYKKRDIAKYAQGSTIVHLYYNHFKKMLIDLPIYEEQKKIAVFLISIDKVIESKQQQITEAEQWEKGLMQGLFI